MGSSILVKLSCECLYSVLYHNLHSFKRFEEYEGISAGFYRVRDILYMERSVLKRMNYQTTELEGGHVEIQGLLQVIH